MELVFFLLFAAIMVGAVRGMKNRAFGAVLEGISQARQMPYRRPGLFGSPSIEGAMRGYATSVRTVRRGVGKRRRTFTRFELGFGKDLGLGLMLSPQGIFSGVSRMLFHRNDILVGDHDFDRQVVVSGHDLRGIPEFLTAARRFHLLRFLSREGHRVITDTGVAVEVPGRRIDQRYIESVLDSMADIADQMVSEEPPPLSRALNAREEGDLDAALEELEPRTLDAPAGDRAVLQGELLYAAERFHEATAAFDEAVAAAPDDVEAAAWRDRARARSEQREPPPLPDAIARPPEPASDGESHETPTEASAPAAASPEAHLSIERVSGALFGPSVSSLKVNALFEERFEGRDIEWVGVIHDARRTAFDLVFGNQPCTKTTIDLEPGESSSTRALRAVVALPAEDEKALRSRKGHSVRFRGRLVKCDAFMRNLFVADATLL